MKPSFQSEHFTLHTLAEGVYAAIGTEMGAGSSNAGLIDLGDTSLVFDAFENPQAAEDLLTACLRLTARKPASVIVSHFHPDHWAGLQVFKGCLILATRASRQEMIPIAKEMSSVKQDPSGMENELREKEDSLSIETDLLKRHQLIVSIARQRHSLQALPTLEPTLPDQIFKGNIVFQGTRRSADLIDLGKGHTKSDCVLRLPQDGVAFIGDIGFFQSQPFMASCFPARWLAILDDMLTWDVETFVPGHGPLGSKDDLALEASYIRTFEDMIRGVTQSGYSLEDALRLTLPPPFDDWQARGLRRFEANVRSSFNRHSTGKDRQ